jgi:predicted transcriptional regulator
MSHSGQTILEVLFPKVRAKVLRLLFSAPGNQRYVRQLALMSGLNIHTVHDELRKLSALELVTSWSDGFHRFYQPNREHRLYSQLCRIVEVSERSPRTKHSKLRRLPGRVAKKAKLRKPPPLPRDRPINWHLFSQ